MSSDDEESLSMNSNNSSSLTEFSPARDSFPNCIVWSALPPLTWLLPPVGHLGIVTSSGTICDFAGPYTIHQHKKRTVFGPVAKYIRVSPADIEIPEGETFASVWNKSIARANECYEGKVHNLFTENCHHHVASVLNELKYKQFTHWGTVTLIVYFIAKGSFTSSSRFFRTYSGFFVLLILALFIGLMVAFIK